MSEKSPTPYNPRDRIKRHLKRKSSSRSLAPALDACNVSNSFKLFPDIETESCPVPSTSSNPFKVGSPLKKRQKPQQHVNFADSVFDVEENAQDPFNDDVFSYSQTKENQKTPTKSPRKSPRKKVIAKRSTFERYQSFDPKSMLKECYATDFSQLLDKKEKSANEIGETFEESENIPDDFRIATKIRIISKVPFSWMNSRKSTGIVTVRLPATDRYDGLKYFNDRLLNIGNLGILEASTLYYQFPIIPGMSLYPRITTEIGTVQRVPMSPLATTTMFNQWVESYEQLFHSYKKGDRQTFYVACAVFNVLFTKTEEIEDFGGEEDSQSCFRMSNGQKLIAIVSHTTSAVREHLRSQGVDYEVIGKPKSRLSIDTSMTGFDDTNDSPMIEFQPDQKPEPTEIKEESEEDENESPTKANQQWLKEIGVSPKNVMKNSLARKLSTRLSERNEGILSLLVKGSSVQSLYNTLMSSDIVHEKTGPYTKIPPTLIAESSFLYGQLLSLNKTSHIVQRKGNATEYILELDRGPILPHTSKLLTQFLRRSQFCSSTDPVIIRASDRHSNNGMNCWNEKACDWTQVHVFSELVKWAK